MDASRQAAAIEFSNYSQLVYQQATLEERAQAASTFRRSGGDGFLPQDFAQQVKRKEVRIPGSLNYTNLFTYAATTTFADNAQAFSYTNPSDRFVIVWAMGLEMGNLFAAAGTMPADGPLRQLRGLCSVIMNFPIGKAIQRSYAEFDLGTIEIEQDGQTTLVGAAMSQQNIRERLRRMIVRAQPLGVLRPNDMLTVGLANLQGATVADSVSGVGITQFLLLEEYVMS